MQESFAHIELGAQPLWPLDVHEDNSSTIKRIAMAIAVGIGFGVLSAAGRGLSHSVQHIAPVRIADGMLTAFLLYRPRSRWWSFLLAAWLGDVISILIPGAMLGISCALASCNVAEVLIAALLLKWAIGRNRDLASPAIMLQFLLFAVLLAPALTGLLAAVCCHLAYGSGIWTEFTRWFPAYAVGMAVMTPFTLALYNPNLRKLFDRARALRTIGVLVLVPLVADLVFQQTHHSLRFLWLPLLMLVVLEVGMLGAVISVFEVLIIGTLFTLHGDGPLWLEKGATLQNTILLLQFSILVLLISVVPFAAILERERQLRTRLRLGMKRYQLLADNSRDIVVLANLEGHRLYVSPAVRDVLGWTQEEWTDQNSTDLMHSEDTAEFRRMLKEMLHGEDHRTFRYRTLHKNGQYLWMEANVRTLTDEITGEPNALVANVRDISERVDSEKKLAEAHRHVQEQAQRDSLTQLANRRCFDEALEREWRRGRRTGNPLALLMVDVDHFKRINDSYGHRAGDQCLQALAAILREVARRPSDLKARYGGEEFAVLLPDVNMDGAVMMAEILCMKVRDQLFNAGVGGPLALTVSVGVAAQVPNKDARADQLVEAADQALYAAKQAGRDRVMPVSEEEVPVASLHPVQ